MSSFCAGHALADLHINYESILPSEGVEIEGHEVLIKMEAYDFYCVNQMRLPKEGQKVNIIYNGRLFIQKNTLKGLPKYRQRQNCYRMNHVALSCKSR